MAIKPFFKDERGTSFEGIALSVSIIAVAFVASADMLDFMTKSPRTKIEVVAAHRAVPATATDELDGTPTASLPKMITRSVLDPCTGATR